MLKFIENHKKNDNILPCNFDLNLAIYFYYNLWKKFNEFQDTELLSGSKSFEHTIFKITIYRKLDYYNCKDLKTLDKIESLPIKAMVLKPFLNKLYKKYEPNNNLSHVEDILSNKFVVVNFELMTRSVHFIRYSEYTLPPYQTKQIRKSHD